MENEKVFILLQQFYEEFSQFKKHTERELQQIQGIEGIQGIKNTVIRIENDHGQQLKALHDGYQQNTEQITGLKQAVANLEHEVGDLKLDVMGLKQDVGGLKQDVGILKQDVASLKQEVAFNSERLDRIEIAVSKHEDVISRKITQTAQ